MATNFGMRFRNGDRFRNENNGSREFERKLGDQIYTPSHIRIRREQFKSWFGSRDMKKMILKIAQNQSQKLRIRKSNVSTGNINKKTNTTRTLYILEIVLVYIFLDLNCLYWFA